MRFTAIHIDGFGIFHDLDVVRLSPGLNVFLGDNESGKTTLLAFIRTILFGFPPGQRRENLYPPFTGGRHGGRLTLLGQEGEEYVITRHQGRKRGPVTVTLPNGSQGDDEVLRQLTGAATEDLFRSVFAFSLSELQSFDSLNSQAVKSALYSAGAGVGKVSLAKVEKDLQDSIGRIFKPTGRKPVINGILKELQEIDFTIGQRVAEVDRYDELRDELDQMAVEIEDARNRLNTKRHRLERVRLLQRGWEDWVALCRIQEEIADLPKIEVFPAEGVNRLEKLRERNRLVNVHRAELAQKIAQVEKELDTLEMRPRWLEAGEQIRLLERKLERFSAASKELVEISPRLQNQRQSLENDLKGLGPDWRLDHLDRFDASLSAREEILRYLEGLEGARDGKRQSERNFVSATSGLKQAKVRAQEAEKAVRQISEPQEKDPAVLLKRRQRLRSLRNLIHLGRDLHRRLEQLKERQEDLQKQKDGLNQQMERIGIAPLWPIAIAVLLSAAAGLATGWYRDLFTGAIVATVGLLITFTLLWISLGQRKRQKAQKDILIQQFYEIEEKLDTLSGKEGVLLAEIRANDQEIVHSAQTLRFRARPSLEEVDQAEAEVEADQETLHLWQPAQQRYQECREETERRQRELAEAEQNMGGSQKALQELKQQWSGWLDQAGLAESLTPNSALEVMERIRSLRQQAGSLRELEKRQQVLKRFVQDYQEEAKSVAQHLEASDIVSEDAEKVVHGLISGLEKAEEAQRRRDALQKQWVEYKGELEQNSAHLRQVEKELNGLFTEGGATDESEFRRRANLYENRLAAKGAFEQHLRNLENLGGRGEDQVRFQEDLQGYSPERLQADGDELNQEVQALEEKLSLLQEQFGRLDERRKQLESAEELSILRQRRKGLLAELSETANRWSVLTICLHFLRKARQIYEKERKQPVLRESEHFFRTITNGRYHAIMAPHGEENIEVVGANGSRYELDILSRGTAEQLYLSLRFGYIQEFGRRARPLPVVMDDILVNFDPHRARASISAILELADRNQVLFFTCHPETVSLIKEHNQNIPVWRLEGGDCRGA
ncbi:MAG: AAA family ATPase [Deltaproteobacteria bacterium]|nr:AAA family ATPase [Deltaproteobacteria bacterium]